MPPTWARPCPCGFTEPLKSRYYDPAREDQSGYTNVYRGHSTVHPWRARPKIGGRLQEAGSAALPHQAAVLVARWYLKQFGPHWGREVGKRKQPKPWRILRLSGKPSRGLRAEWACWRAFESAEDGGWLLFVWEWNKEVCVREVKRGRSGRWVVPRESKPGTKPRGRVKVFASREAAKAHVVKWFVERWGLLAFLAVQRG